MTVTLDRDRLRRRPVSGRRARRSPSRWPCLRDLADDGVLRREPDVLARDDEELAPGGTGRLGLRLGHRDHAFGVGGVARRHVDGGVAGAAAGPRRVASLDDETGNDSMELRAVEEAVIRELDERLGGLRREPRIELDREVASGRLDDESIGRVGVELDPGRGLLPPSAFAFGASTFLQPSVSREDALLCRRRRSRRAPTRQRGEGGRGGRRRMRPRIVAQSARPARAECAGDLDLVRLAGSGVAASSSMGREQPWDRRGTGSAILVSPSTRAAATPTRAKAHRSGPSPSGRARLHLGQLELEDQLARLSVVVERSSAVGSRYRSAIELAPVGPDRGAEREQGRRRVGRVRRGTELVAEERVLAVLALPAWHRSPPCRRHGNFRRQYQQRVAWSRLPPIVPAARSCGDADGRHASRSALRSPRRPLPLAERRPGADRTSRRCPWAQRTPQHRRGCQPRRYGRAAAGSGRCRRRVRRHRSRATRPPPRPS